MELIFMAKKIVLIDQDNTIADFEQGFLNAWRNEYSEREFIELQNRKNPKIYQDYPEKYGANIKAIHTAPKFLLGLEPIRGSVEALKEMMKEGLEVRICTSPFIDYENCVLEKYLWIEKYLGREFTKNIILTRDKTLIKGDILIDDSPEIKGLATPEWEHIVFDKPYNKQAPGRRLSDWSRWREIIQD